MESGHTHRSIYEIFASAKKKFETEAQTHSNSVIKSIALMPSRIDCYDVTVTFCNEIKKSMGASEGTGRALLWKEPGGPPRNL